MGRVVIRRGRIEAKAITPEKRKHNWLVYDSQATADREYVEGRMRCTVCGKKVEAGVLIPGGSDLRTGLENVRAEIMAEWADENVGPCG